MKNILITGGAGFIGASLCETLLAQNKEATIVCLDNFDPFYDKAIKEKNIKELLNNPRFVLATGSITDTGLLNTLFLAHNFDLVYHLAAKAGVRPSIDFPNEYYEINIKGTQNILDAMVKHKVKRLIFASSSSVYGANTKVPFSEEDPVCDPISPYAASKRACELICSVANKLYGLNIMCVRFFTVYGPRQRPEMAIHKFTRMIDEGLPLPAFGDGNTERDYTYIDDITQGLINLAESDFNFEIINFGESETTKLKELIAYIELSLGKKANINWMPSQPGDVDRTFADISKATNKFKYQPKTKVKQGIENFVQWYNKNK